MQPKKPITFVLIVVAIATLACGLDGLPFSANSPLSTPTLAVARFTTPTATPIPSDTPVVEPTDPPMATPEITATPEPAEEVETAIEEETEEPVTAPEDDDSEEGEQAEAVDEPTEAPTLAATPLPEAPTVEPTEEPPTPTPAALSGRIAFPIDDGAGFYDIWIFEVPDGEPFQVHRRGRQPSFSSEGRLLVNNHGSDFGENIGVLDVNYAWLGLVSDTPEDGHAFWHPDGSRYVFSNPKLLIDPLTEQRLPHVFIPCSIRRPSEEDDVKCRDFATFGKVHIGEFPVWTDDDRIAFFNFEGDDGIYVSSGASTLWQAGGLSAPLLLVKGNGRPNDTQGFQVFFSAGNIDQNWEAYSIDLDGSNLINLSNSPVSQDGLPTVSPDGNWVAFVSDRDGLWGIWVVPRTGGEARKLLDLSKINTNPSPWGVDDRDWTFERMTWGP